MMSWPIYMKWFRVCVKLLQNFATDLKGTVCYKLPHSVNSLWRFVTYLQIVFQILTLSMVMKYIVPFKDNKINLKPIWKQKSVKINLWWILLVTYLCIACSPVILLPWLCRHSLVCEINTRFSIGRGNMTALKCDIFWNKRTAPHSQAFSVCR
jgi:hypothetical protein